MPRDGNDINRPAEGKHKPTGTHGGLRCDVCEQILARLIYIRAGYVCTILTIAIPVEQGGCCHAITPSKYDRIL